jgi:CDP-diacylglycerol---glycerol-3-phosphate 3-phosphatidyltransferase
VTSGPRLVNVANVLTVIRILLVPVFVACLLAGGTVWRLGALAAFCVYVLPATLSPPAIVRELVMGAAVVVTVVTGVDYVQQAMRLRRSESAAGG